MLEKKPFRKYKLDGEEQEDREVFSVSVNKQEREWLNQIKQDLNVRSDGKALKMSAFIGKNVLHMLFGDKFLKYLFKKKRDKLED